MSNTDSLFFYFNGNLFAFCIATLFYSLTKHDRKKEKRGKKGGGESQSYGKDLSWLVTNGV